MFESWKNEVLGKNLDTDGVPADMNQCCQVVASWANALFPALGWAKTLGAVKVALDYQNTSNKYFTFIKNNHSDVNQLPMQGDILIFGATPAKGYTNTFNNPAGHAGVCDSASPSGYTLVQCDAPAPGEYVNDTSYPWNYRPCLGWLRASVLNVPVVIPPTPVSSSNVGKTIHFAATNTAIPVWNVGGPYDEAHHTHMLDPALFKKELDYTILQDLGNGLYAIQTSDFGRVAVSIQGQNATIS